MSIQYINTGTAPNSGNGDVLRTAFNKVNANFKEITSYIVQSSTPPTTTGTTVLWYDTVGGRMYIYFDGSWVDTSPIFLYPYASTGTAGVVKVDGSTLIKVNSSGTIAVNANAFPNNIIPATNAAYDLGSPSAQWRSVYISTGSLYVGNSVINADSEDGPLNVTSPLGVMINSTSTFNNNVLLNQNLTVTGNIQFLGTSTQGNAGRFFGDTFGIGALYAGVSNYTFLPVTVLQASANIDSYIQNNFQNTNPGVQSSTEWVATADNGTDSINYVDMGIAGGSWDGSQANSLGTAAQPNDAWVYTLGDPIRGTGGNLIVGTAQDGKNVLILSGSSGASSVVATFNSRGLFLNGSSNLTFVDGTQQTTAWTGNVITNWQASPTTTTYIVAATDSVILVDNNGQNVEVSLPASPPQGKQYTIKKTDGTGLNVNVDVVGGALIDNNVGTVTIASTRGYLTVIADSNNAYWIINELL
jgi:hypothetical protein